MYSCLASVKRDRDGKYVFVCDIFKNIKVRAPDGFRPDHNKYRITYEKKENKKVLVSFEPVHVFETDLRSSDVKFTGNAVIYSGNIERTCKICGYREEKHFEIVEPASAVSIGDKLYLVPERFCVFEPIPLESVSSPDDVKPSVEYVELASGLYVPKGYVSDKVMKKLEELDGKYNELDTAYKKKCLPVCKDFRTFEKIKTEMDGIVAEQAEIIVEELSKRGFVFDVKKSPDIYDGLIAQVRGPDGAIGYYRCEITARDYFPYCCFMGKWAPLGTAAKAALVLRGKYPTETAVLPVESAGTCYDARLAGRSFRDCLDTVFLVTDHGVHEKADKYIVKYADVGWGIGIALSVAHVHSGKTMRSSVKYIDQNRIVWFDSIAMRCKICGKVLTSYIVHQDIIDVITLNGELGYIHTDYAAPINTVYDDPTTSRKSETVYIDNVKPLVNYLELPSGLYVPLEYIDTETLKKLVELEVEKGADAAAEQAKIIVNELERKGFRFIAGNHIDVIGPDNSSSEAYGDLFVGKWGPLAKAFRVAKNGSSV